ncbi:MAG: hypothetical protein ACK4OM_05990 [Alphaproteobacteria bacterium]
MANHFSTAAQFNKFANNIGALQSKLSKIPDQIEGKVDNFSSFGSASKIDNYINTKAKLNLSTNYITEDKIVEAKLVSMDQSLESIINTAIEMKKNLTLKNSSAGKALNMTQITRANLSNIQDCLNVSHAGNYLFSGSKTDTMPVTDLSKTNILNNVITANYYKGDSFVNKAQIDNQFPLDFGITASNPAFQNLIASMNYIIEYEKTNDPLALNMANKLMDDSIKEIVQIRSEVGNNLNSIKNVIEKKEDVKSYLTEVEADLSPVDPLKTILQLSNDKVALEALFKTFSTVSSLNLTMYLK